MNTSMLNFNRANLQKNQPANPQFDRSISSPNSLSIPVQSGFDRVELKLKPIPSQILSLKFTGENNLHQAIKKGISDEAFDELVTEVEKHSDTEMLNEKGGPNEDTPLHAAVRVGSKYKVARLIGALGIILNDQNTDHLTPLDLAVTLKSSGGERMAIYQMLFVASGYPVYVMQ